MISAGSAQLLKIEISDFKSFVGRWLITPIMSWTCIMAPNGSGKSNFIDALVFCLGENDEYTMRVRNLSDLVPHLTTHEPNPYVDLTIGSKDEFTKFRRSLWMTDENTYESLYAIDDQLVSVEDYNYSIRCFGINITAKDFIVYQGEIENIVRASPLERANLLEIASGSIHYKCDYDTLKIRHSQVLERIKTQTTNKKQLRMQVKHLTATVKELKESERNKAQYVEKLKALYLLSLKINDLKRQKAIEEESAAAQVLNKIKNLKKKTKAWAESSKKIQDCEVQLSIAEKELKIVNEDSQRANDELLKCNASITKIKKFIDEDDKCQEAIKDLDFHIDENQTLLLKYTKKIQEDFKIIIEYEDEYEILLKEMYLRRNEILSQSKAQESYKKIIELDSKKRELSFLNRQIGEMSVTVDKNICEIEANQLSHAKLIEELKGLKEEYKKTLKDLLPPKEIENLLGEKQKIEQQLLQRRLSIEKDNRMRKQAKIVAILKLQFPGMVYDRIRNLCAVSDSKFKLAMAAAMDKKLNSIIVQDDETAIACIKYLEDNKLGFETFYAIQGVNPPQIDRSILRSTKGTKLVYDILKFDYQFDPVIKTIVKSTLLCESLEEAWDAMDTMAIGKKYNIVTMSGDIVSTSGIVTMGCSQKKVQASHISTSSELDLGRAKDFIEKKLEKANCIATRKMATEIKAKLHEKLTALKILDVSTDYMDKQNAQLKEKLAKVLQAQQMLEQEISHLETFNKNLDVEFKEISDMIFADFCEKTHISSREQFENLRRERNSIEENVDKCKNHLCELQSHKAYEESRLKSNDMKKLQEDVKSLEKQGDMLDRLAAEARERVKAANLNVKRLEEVLNEEKASFDKIQEKRLELAESERENREKTATARNIMEKLKFDRSEIISAARKDGIPLPVQNQPNQSQSSGEDSQKVFDFTDLKENWRTSNDISFLKMELQTLETTLAEMKKNIREFVDEDVEENLIEMHSSLSQVEGQLKQLRRNAKNLSEQLEKVRSERYQRFADFFTTVEAAIDQIYKKITSSESGYAALIPERPDEPYLAGIRFDFTPPGKSFRSGEDLSGGEKNMAALAFLFALQEARTSSFILLDEVDGAFDNQNINGLIEYLKVLKKSHQLFMISHNLTINISTDALLCIAPDRRISHLESKPMLINLKSKFPHH